MAGDWFLGCPDCGQTYYGATGHICPVKQTGESKFYTYPSPHVSSNIYYYITKEEYERLKQDSEDLAAIRKALGWKTGK